MGLTNLDVGLVTSSTSQATCAANASGLYCWGQGPLGTGSAPSPVTTPPTTPTISSGLFSFAIGVNVGGAVTSSGLQMWGDNTQGQLGDGTYTSQWSPETIARQNVDKVVVGQTHVCALTKGQPGYRVLLG